MKTPLMKIYSLLAGQNRAVIEIAVGTIIHLTISLLPALFIKQVLDTVVPQQNDGLLKFMATLVTAMLFAQGLIAIIKNISILKSGHTIQERLLQRYNNKLLHMPQNFFDQFGQLELLQRVNDSIAIRSALNELFTIGLRGSLTIVMSFAVMFSLSPKFAATTILLMGAYSVFAWIVGVLSTSGGQTLEKSAFDLERKMFENINSMRTIRQFSMQDATAKSTNETMKPVLNSINSNGIMNIYGSALGDFSSKAFSLILIWVGTLFIFDGSFGIGTLICFLMLTELCKAPIGDLMMLSKLVHRAGIASDNIHGILTLPIRQEKNASTNERQPQGDINFKDIAFHYPGKPDILIDLNFTLRKSQITAILGPPGSGKSAIAELLQFSYQAQRGDIFIGSSRANDYSGNSLRRKIYVATDSTDVLAMSFAKNVAPHEEHPDLSRIMSLSIQLGIVHFIERLPGGFDTILGRDMELNEQQKKIIGLLRAFYFDADVLILDEPTRSLELSTSASVRKMILDRQRCGTTIVLLTSKLEIAAIADEIISIDKGVVVSRSSPVIPASVPCRT